MSDGLRRILVPALLASWLFGMAPATTTAAERSSSPSPIVLDDERLTHSVIAAADALVDATGDLDIDQVAHGSAFGPLPTFGRNDGVRRTFWFRFVLGRAPHDASLWYLVSSANCLTADLYVPIGKDGFGHRSFGRSVPLSQHPAPGLAPAILLDENAFRGKADFLRLGGCRKHGLQASIASGFALSEAFDTGYVQFLLQEFAIAIFALLGIVFFAITRERMYLLSAAPPLAYDSIFFTFLTAPRAFPSLAMPPFDATWTVTHILFFIAQWAFMRVFLELPVTQKTTDRCFTALLAALILTYLVGDFGPYDGSLYEAFAEVAFYVPPIVGAILAMRAGSRRARFFIAGTALVALSVIDTSLFDSGVRLFPAFVSHWVVIAAMPLESLLFFVGVADRLRRTIVEREQALAESDAAKAALVEAQERNIVEIERRNVSFGRFVPREFLEVLARADIVDVGLGDHCERAMSVLFSDIRGFTGLVERLSPAETFAFLNSFLERAGPAIRQNDGFIDKYIGDAIMALFPREPSNAVEAALTLQREVRQFNDVRARRGLTPIAIGVGINYGDLMMGTIGEAERYETTVLADAVNIASRLEGLSKRYGAGIVAGGALVRALPEAHGYHLRRLGTVLLKGFTQTVDAYEVFDGDPFDLLLHKAETLDRFEAGLAAYRRGAFDESKVVFSEIARLHRDDRAAAWLCDRSAALAEDLDLRWDGIDRMESK